MNYYKSFNEWKVEYNVWSQDQEKNDQMFDLINSSLNFRQLTFCIFIIT